MSKIAQYLNEHIVGTVTANESIRHEYAHDGSVLTVMPELVAFPRVTNDIRKIARFSWQLAEKGHTLALTPRGYGKDQTGAAIGKGVVIDASKYLQSIILVVPKDKRHLVHVQGGASLDVVNSALQWHGLTLSSGASELLNKRVAVASVIANGSTEIGGTADGTTVLDKIEKLEVVLANGDLLETGRISKRELNKKKGLQTLEGEIYRQIDGIIEDNRELIDTLSSDSRLGKLGYAIEQVKQKDGSVDLTPLFVGSQGTLGIISEAVLRADFYSIDESTIVTVLPSFSAARDFAESIRNLAPSSLDCIDGRYFTEAQGHGKRYICSGDVADDSAAVLYISFTDFSDRNRDKKCKKIVKLLEKQELPYYTSSDHSSEELRAVRDVRQFVATQYAAKDEVAISVLEGAHVPSDRFESFAGEIAALADKHHVDLPLYLQLADEVVHVGLSLPYKTVSSKQKIFKILKEYVDIVYAHEGAVLATAPEGRLKPFAVYDLYAEGIIELNEKIRTAFDPYGTLNPGVKQAGDVRAVVKMIRSDFSPVDTL